MRTKITRRDFVKSLGAGVGWLGLGGCGGGEGMFGAGERPNFVVIFCDDVGYGDIGCYGAQGWSTPHLDRMAAEGMRFTDFYVAAPSCTPSRASLLMGCYPQRVSLPDVLFPSGPAWTRDKTDIGINSDEETVAEILKERGYVSGCFGKWHLGHHKKFLPTRHGFDEYLGLPYSNDMCPENNKAYPPLPLVEGEDIIENNPDQSRLTTLYTERAVQFIEKNKDSPFFLYVPHTMAHVPLFVSEKFRGKSEQGLYGDVMMEIDWSAGEILSALKRCGVDENTLVIFTSDNGPWLSFGEHGGTAGPLREGKGTTWEGGMREPCIMRWPGRIAAGSVCSELTTTMDILPTFARLAGAGLPKRRIDGKDIRALMFGEPGAKSPCKAFFYYRSGELQAVRSGRWKLHLPHKYRTLGSAEGGKGGKSVGYKEGEVGFELFDLQNDIGETRNLAEEEPDVVGRLKKLVDKAREDLGDTLVGIKGRNVREPGRI